MDLPLVLGFGVVLGGVGRGIIGKRFVSPWVDKKNKYFAFRHKGDFKLKKIIIYVLAAFCMAIFCTPLLAHAEVANSESIIVATGEDVPLDDHLPEENRFPAKYRENAVQFRTEDGVLLCGWVIGEGTRGITLGHANGWGPASWLPFGERLVDEGYMVIIWAFRGLYPSGDDPSGSDLRVMQRWDLDVLAAAQVLRERGAMEILSMGASDGGNATAVAATHIPELVGLGILSSPAMSKGDGPAALSEITVPAFFAVSNNDPGSGGGERFLQEVQKLYDACASEQKELHVLTSYEHGTDLLSDVDVYSALAGSTEEQKQERRQLADDLMRFVNGAFGINADETAGNEDGTSSPAFTSDNSETVAFTPTQPMKMNNPTESNHQSLMIIWIALGIIFIGVLVIVFMHSKK